MLALPINQVCLCLLICILTFMLYSFTINSDPYHCGALLSGGHWMNSPDEWQPPDCMMRTYRRTDLLACRLRNLQIIGDSTMRELFWATAEKLDSSGAEDAIHEVEKHSNVNFSRDGIDLSFIWDPFLNSSALQHSLEAHRSGRSHATSILVIGGGLWHVGNLGDRYLQDYRDTIDMIMPFMNPGWPEEDRKPYTDTFTTGPNNENLLILAPVQVPRYSDLKPERAASMTQQRIDPMNDYLRQLHLRQSAHVAWSWSRMVQQQPEVYQGDGLHVTNSVAAHQIDVVLNMRCNSQLSKLDPGYPMDNTCCNGYARPLWIQRLFLMLSLGFLPLLTCLAAKDPHGRAFLPSRKVMQALTTVALAASYCFYADRTQLFHKLHKHFSTKEFTLMSIAIVVLGVLSIRRSVHPLSSRGLHATTREVDHPFLSRDQTDEWKGWMQFVILIYHYTGASKILGIYKIIRILVASYLFMTGFGHAAFFYRKSDYSLHRCAAVLIRINLLSCLLPYIMGTDYLFYYFAPLTSLWYLVIYLTMRFRHDANTSVRFLVGKVLISAFLVTAFVRMPGVLEAIFQCLKVTAKIHWNVTEWRFRTGLDLYIVYAGMLSAIAFIKISESTNVKSSVYFTRLRTLLTVAALPTLGFVWVALGSIMGKSEYNSWVPYISFLPILSYVTLRNCSRQLRNYYSSIFAWLGRYSLETFTLQFHIWLAADTKGILSIGLHPWWSSLLLSVIFFWVSWHVGCATNVITSWIIDSSEGPGYGGQGVARSDIELPSHECPKVHPLPYGYRFRPSVMLGDLRFRLASLMTAMWILNLLYE